MRRQRRGEAQRLGRAREGGRRRRGFFGGLEHHRLAEAAPQEALHGLDPAQALGMLAAPLPGARAEAQTTEECDRDEPEQGQGNHQLDEGEAAAPPARAAAGRRQP